MKILAISGTSRPKGTTVRLTEEALKGAASEGADTEMILLVEQDMKFCRNCLTCYKDTESEIGPCSIEDDVRGILEKIKDADGVFFTSPVHSGFVSGLMVAFMERAAWTLLKPTGELLGMKGSPVTRMPEKTRAVATIVSAGGVPSELRKYCDQGTPWLVDMAGCICNGSCIGDTYASAYFTKELEGDEWSRSYFFRELTEEQLHEAYDLGVKMARTIKKGKVRPYDVQYLLQNLTK